MKKLASLVGVILIASVLLASCTPAPTTSSGTSAAPGGTSATQTGTSAAPAQSVKWRAQSNEVSGTARYAAVEYFCEKLKEASGGRFEIELYPSDVLYPTMNAIEATKQGIVEASFTTGDYMAGKEPMLKLVPYRTSDPWEHDFDTMSKFFEKMFPLVKEAYESFGGIVYVDSVVAYPGESLHSTKKITGLADFKNLLIRSSGLGQELYQALGASIVTMPMTEVYQALQLNTIEAFEAGGYMDNYQSALHEVVKYNIEPALHSPVGVNTEDFIINEKAWNALPDDLRELIASCAEDSRKHCWDDLTAQYAEGKKLFEAAGVETLTLPEEDVKAARLIAAQTLKAYWGKSELTDKFLQVYMDFLTEIGRDDLAKAIAK